MDSVEQVMKGLTKAQARMLGRLDSGICFLRYADMRTLDALDRKGLTGRYMRHSDMEVLVTLTDQGRHAARLLSSSGEV